MWTVLFALFSVTLHSVADTFKNAYYAPVPSLYWSGGWDGEWNNKDSVVIVETTPPNFVDTVKEYTAVVPYDAKYLRLHVKWDSVGPRSSTDTLQAIVKNGNERIWADSGKSEVTSVFDSVYSVPFKSKTDYDINGTFGFDLPSALGGGTKSYSLKIPGFRQVRSVPSSI